MKAYDDAELPSANRRGLLKRLARAFCIYVVVPYCSVVIIFAALQRQLLYRPTTAKSLAIHDLQMDADFGFDVQQTTADGTIIRGWLIKGSSRQNSPLPASETDQNPLVIYFPGNSLNRHHRINDLREIASRGFDVLIFDYRGFGDSGGSPSETALSDDAILVWRYAVGTLGYPADRIVVFGESIGGAVAISLWANKDRAVMKPAALILNSTFVSMPDVVQWNYPLFPFHWLLLDRWPSIQEISNVTSPIVVFHGTDDQMVPAYHGQLLADAATDGKFIEVRGGVHNEIPTAKLRKELDLVVARLTALEGGAAE